MRGPVVVGVLPFLVLAACGAPTQTAACEAYVACDREIVPEATGALLASYGPDGSCWSSEEAAAACDDACTDAMALDFAAHPELTQCWPLSEASGDTLSIDGTSWRFVDGAVVVGNGMAWLYLTTFEVACDGFGPFTEPEHPPTYAKIFAPGSGSEGVQGYVDWHERGADPGSVEIAYGLEFDQAISDDLAAGSTVTGRLGLSGKGPAGLAGEDPVGVVGFEVEVCRPPGT